MGNWSFWLITAGISIMGLVLTAGGLQQGYHVDGRRRVARTRWLPMSPYWFVRTLAGLSHGHRHVAAGLQPDDDGADPPSARREPGLDVPRGAAEAEGTVR